MVRLACPIGLLFLLTFLEHRFYPLAHALRAMAVEASGKYGHNGQHVLNEFFGGFLLPGRVEYF